MAVGPRIDKTGARPRFVVVVDDDPSVRDVCADVLVEAGYRVEAFGEGEAALRALEAMAVDVLVVDWKMPGLDGAEIARRARALDPRLPVLMITGSRGEAAEPAGRAGIHRLLDKPFRVEDLVAVVAALAEGAGS